MKLSIEEPTGEPFVPMVYDITPNQWVYQIQDMVFTVWGEERSDGYMVTGVYHVYARNAVEPSEMQYLFGQEDDFLWEDQSEAINEVAAGLVEWMKKRDGIRLDSESPLPNH